MLKQTPAKDGGEAKNDTAKGSQKKSSEPSGSNVYAGLLPKNQKSDVNYESDH